MKAVKTIVCSLIALAMCLSLAACMNNAPKSTTQTGYMPEATNQVAGAVRDAGQSIENGVNNLTGSTQQPVAFDWVTGSGMIEGNVNRISEISDSRVVVTGSTALVGVKFTSAYQGDVTERIREMVAAEVMKADPSIQTVAVTAEEDDVNAVWEISEKLRSGEPPETLSNRINEIVRNATTMR